MGGGEGGASDDSQPMMIHHSSIDDLNQQPRSNKRKRDSSELFGSKDKGQQSDSLLCEFKEKVNKLRSKRSMKIKFTARSVSEAYRSLHICTDPRGFEIENCNTGDSFDPEIDMIYLTILWRLANSPEIQVAKGSYENSKHLSKLVSDITISPEDIDECLEEYSDIYYHAEKAASWKCLKDFISAPNTELEYSRDPPNFEQKLRMDYMILAKSEITSVLKAFVSWWTSKSTQDKEAAMRLITYKYEEAQEFSDNRLQKPRGYTRLDYLKLKVDVAGKIGIINHVPEELAKFHLPGHYEWPPEEDF